ncbi:peptidoglycan hydrolase-like protein with peptidoglycan-binding domain [Catenulispora sp. GP43]|uniref:peptidoglycan-binding domain-containing protein n=1 Tax=Catenulispora sp. GP43 TaxID=3156263 RepID=UPI00351789C3
MKSTTRIARLGTAAAATLLAAGAGLATAEQASANSYGSMSLPQLQQLCESHGQRTWPTPGGGTIVIPTEQVQYGSTGDCVAFAQKLLVYSAYNIGVDGQFGPQTQSAVTSFQKSKLWNPACGPADSVVGPRTWMCLEFQN